MIVYKLANHDRTTYGGFLWGPKGWSPPILKGKGKLCTKSWYHGYEDPLLAALHGPAHVSFKHPILFAIAVAKADVRRDGQVKLGFRLGVVQDDVPLPEPTLEQRVRYGLGAALVVYHEPSYVSWASGWIDGQDRSQVAARRAAEAAWMSEWIDGQDRSQVAVAVRRGRVAARRAQVAAQAAAGATWRAAAQASEAALSAALSAAEAATALNLLAIAHWAMSTDALNTASLPVWATEAGAAGSREGEGMHTP